MCRAVVLYNARTIHMKDCLPNTMFSWIPKLRFTLMKKKLLIGFLLLLTSACNLPVSTPVVDPTPTQTPLPTPTTVSVTPSLVPTETAVPTPEPPPLYFTDEFDTSTPYWEFTQAAGSSLPTNAFEGSLRIDLPSPDTWVVGIHTAHTYENVFVSARSGITPNGSVGLICRYSESGWYEFNISNGSYSILYGQWLAPGIAKYVPIISEASEAALAGGSDLGFFCEDNFLQVFANGKLLRRVDVTNYGLTEGNVGVAFASFSEFPAAVSFDWFKVSEK